MKSGLLFEPPAKPRSGLCDEEIAIKVVRHLKRWAKDALSFYDDDIDQQDETDLIEAMMATDTDDWKFVTKWLRDHRPYSEWKWEDKELVLEHGFCDACSAVLPIHERRGRFA